MQFHGFATGTNSYCLVINRYELEIQPFYDNARVEPIGLYQWTNYHIRLSTKRTIRSENNWTQPNMYKKFITNFATRLFRQET